MGNTDISSVGSTVTGAISTLNSIVTTGWQFSHLDTPDYMNAFTDRSYFYYRKINNDAGMFVMRLDLNSGTIKGNQNNYIGTLPVGYRPIAVIRHVLIPVTVYQVANSASVQIIIDTDGKINLIVNNDITSFSGGYYDNVCYILNNAT